MLREQYLVHWDFLYCTRVLLWPIIVEWEPRKAVESYIVSVILIAGTCVQFQISYYKEQMSQENWYTQQFISLDICKILHALQIQM